MNDGLGILLALAAVVVPLALAWYLLARPEKKPRGPSTSHKPKK